MNWFSPIIMAVVEIGILITVVAIGIIAIKRGLLRFTTQSKKALTLIFMGLVTLTIFFVSSLVMMSLLPSRLPETEATWVMTNLYANLQWITILIALLLTGVGFLLVIGVVRRYEYTLSESEESYRRIVEDQTELIVRWQRGGIRTWVNDAYCAYLQQPRHKLVGTSFFPILVDKDAGEEIESQISSLSPESPSRTEVHKVLRPDGSETWMEWTDRVIFDDTETWIECQSIGRDITDRKLSEIALADSEAQYRNLIENTTDWVWQIDLEGNHTYTNHQLEIFLGYSEEEISTMSLAELIHPEDLTEVDARIPKLIEEKQGWQHWLLRFKHKDGSIRTLDSNGTPLFDSSGAVIGFTGIDRDVTFNVLLAKISSDLLAADLDISQIDGVLHKLAMHFEVDSLTCWWMDETHESASRTNCWYREGVDLDPMTYELSEIPYYKAQILAGKVVRVSDFNQLPPEAAAEKANAKSLGMTAELLVPLKLGVESEIVGCGSATMCGETRDWSEKEIAEIRIAFNVIATAEARLKDEVRRKDRELFEALLSKISSDLFRSPPGMFDQEIENTLEQIGLSFELDRFGLWFFDSSTGDSRRSYEWALEGMHGPRNSVNNYELLPWATGKLVSGEIVKLETLDDIPSKEQLDRTFFESQGIKSNLTTPLFIDEQIVGVSSLSTCQQTRTWSEESVNRIKLLTEVLANAFVRTEGTKTIQQREKFQRLLSDISTSLLEAHFSEIGRKIEIGLKQIGRHYALDRASLWFFEQGKDVEVRCVHQWAPKGKEGTYNKIIVLETIPWASGIILSGGDLKIESIDDVPPEQKADRKFFEEQGVKSELALSLFIEDQQVGLGVFNTLEKTRLWPKEITDELRLLAEVLMNAYSRSQSMHTIQQREQDLARSEALAHVGSYTFFPVTGSNDWPPMGELHLSEEMQKLLDCTPEEASFDAFISRIHPDDKARALSSIRELFKQGSVLQHEFRLVKPKGEIIHVQDRTELDRKEDDLGVVKVLGTLQDITERVVRENSLIDALAQIKKLTKDLEEENLELRDEIKAVHDFDHIIGNSLSLRNCLNLVKKVAPTDASVLLLGETGTGKELIANAIRDLSKRSKQRMVSVNCASLPESLVESELFGHEKGAFTGADSLRKGRFEIADGGTLFLDEIGELPLPLQSKLLRAIQEGEFERLGGSKTLKVDVRLIAATNRKLKDDVDQGKFRADLYYRICNFPIDIPSLSERKEDIPLLAAYFVQKYASELGKDISAISSNLMHYLTERTWPGNIRELEGFIQHQLISNEGKILTLSLPDKERSTLSQDQNNLPPGGMDTLSNVERDHITEVLSKTDWLIAGHKGAAKILGVPPSTLRSRMKRLGIEHPDKTSGA